MPGRLRAGRGGAEDGAMAAKLVEFWREGVAQDDGEASAASVLKEAQRAQMLQRPPSP